MVDPKRHGTTVHIGDEEILGGSFGQGCLGRETVDDRCGLVKNKTQFHVPLVAAWQEPRIQNKYVDWRSWNIMCTSYCTRLHRTLGEARKF